jgi:hypothetical protein
VDQRVPQRRAARPQLRVALIDGLDLDGNVRLEIRAVSHMQVGADQGVPGVDEAEHGLHFRGVCLRVVAIEVDVFGRGAPTRDLGAVLVRPVPTADAFVTVGVECRHEQQGNALERTGRGGAGQHLAQSNEARVLAIALARMNPPLNHQNGNAPLVQIPRRERAAARHDEGPERTALGGFAVRECAHRVGPCRGHGRTEAFDLIDASGLRVAGFLRQCQECLVHETADAVVRGRRAERSIWIAAYSTTTSTSQRSQAMGSDFTM